MRAGMPAEAGNGGVQPARLSTAPPSDARDRLVPLTDMNEAAMIEMAASFGQPAFRGRQLFHWVHGTLETEFGCMSNLPRPFTSLVAEAHPLGTLATVKELVSSDGVTRKGLLALSDGQRVETVLMEAPAPGHEADRYTVCVSSQVGCALGCKFCVTGQMGFERQLSAGEIVEQVYHFERSLRRASPKGGHRQITNVVFMGMGEPMANFDSVLAAVRLLTAPEGMGLGARRITISTSGLVPGIERMAGEGLQLGLAISLHAPNDQLRDRLMPVNRHYPIAQLMKAADNYASVTGRRVTYEYALMDGVNDGGDHARELGALLSGPLCHVNLIPLNRSLDPALKPSPPWRVAAFRQWLEEAGIACTVRETKGQDILAACGQLRYAEQAPK